MKDKPTTNCTATNFYIDQCNFCGTTFVLIVIIQLIYITTKFSCIYIYIFWCPIFEPQPYIYYVLFLVKFTGT